MQIQLAEIYKHYSSPPRPILVLLGAYPWQFSFLEFVPRKKLDVVSNCFNNSSREVNVSFIVKDSTHGNWWRSNLHHLCCSERNILLLWCNPIRQICNSKYPPRKFTKAVFFCAKQKFTDGPSYLIESNNLARNVAFLVNPAPLPKLVFSNGMQIVQFPDYQHSSLE